MRVKFAHLEHEKSVLDYHGAQIPFIGWDELTHFTKRQFIYMLTRNRSTSGVPAYMRATCNPDADSWVRELIDWYIDGEGYAIPELSGVIRWFVVYNDEICWGDTKEELIEQYTGKLPVVLPKSFTFIPSKVYDNKILLEKDPGYLANLFAQNLVDRMRLEGGNWNIRASAGTVFKREWFPIVDAIPAGWKRAIRFWDRAATKESPANPDPDWTRGLLLYQYPDNTFLVADLKSLRDTPGQVEKFIKNVASHDSVSVEIKSQCDPGSSGKAEAEYFIKMLSGYNVSTEPMFKDKVSRAKPVSAQAEAGNIVVLRADWNKEFFTECESFPDGKHDDIVDTLSGGFNHLAGKGASILDVL